MSQRYQAVVNVRRHSERLAAAALAAARTEVERLRAERDALHDAPQETGKHSAAEAALALLAQERAVQLRKVVEERLCGAERVALAHEQELLAAHQSLRLVELLAERQRDAKRSELEKRETKILEEASRRR
ncbi:MAG: hypothetical protein IT383_22255 [Deltaproteobacteria bacterium]|nr:hypothetical protein [Deltaproteobacteria bacterium]